MGHATSLAPSLPALAAPAPLPLGAEDNGAAAAASPCCSGGGGSCCRRLWGRERSQVSVGLSTNKSMTSGCGCCCCCGVGCCCRCSSCCSRCCCRCRCSCCCCRAPPDAPAMVWMAGRTPCLAAAAAAAAAAAEGGAVLPPGRVPPPPLLPSPSMLPGCRKKSVIERLPAAAAAGMAGRPTFLDRLAGSGSPSARAPLLPAAALPPASPDLLLPAVEWCDGRVARAARAGGV